MELTKNGTYFKVIGDDPKIVAFVEFCALPAFRMWTHFLMSGDRDD